MAEVAVHFSLATLPSDYVMITIDIPDDIMLTELPLKNLPADWNEFPHPSSTQVFGDRFVSENNFCVLKIPSVVTQGDFNILINPGHPDFPRIKIKSIEKFAFDKRLFK